jgi:hypothetical protein
MGVRYRGTCSGCRRTSSFMTPAAGGELYCPDCRAAGRDAPVPRRRWTGADVVFLAVLLGLVAFMVALYLGLRPPVWTRL